MIFYSDDLKGELLGTFSLSRWRQRYSLTLNAFQGQCHTCQESGKTELGLSSGQRKIETFISLKSIFVTWFLSPLSLTKPIRKKTVRYELSDSYQEVRQAGPLEQSKSPSRISLDPGQGVKGFEIDNGLVFYCNLNLTTFNLSINTNFVLSWRP